MSQALDQSVIRILTLEGKTVGTGFVVDEHLAVTCRHVAGMALGRDAAVGEQIRIQYYLDGSDATAELVRLEALDDIAFLRLERLPEGVRPVRLARAGSSDGHRYASLGFPDQSGPVTARKPADLINGVVPAAQAGRQPLLELKGDEVYHGMSGAPVLDTVSDRVVAMISDHKSLEYTNLVYATTADTIQACWPDLPIDPAVGGDSSLMTLAQRHNARDHLGFGLTAAQKNLLGPFLDEYLGDRDPVPFGGREAELAQLDSWLQDPDGLPYLLLTAPAGRGKTHLVVQWAARLIAQAQMAVRVMVIPVSIRFGTAPPEMHLQMLARALAQFYRDPIKETAADTRETWRNICAEYLAKPHRDGNATLVVILDGLDESTDTDADQWRKLIGELPAGTKMLLSARWLADEQDESGWRDRLGLKPARAGHLALPPLDRTGLQKALESMGNPLRGYAQEGAILNELLRVTGGDPLLVRLYVQDLHENRQPEQGQAKTEAKAVLARLKGTGPDLKGYFKRWWQDQRRQWKAQGEDADRIEDEVRELLRLLSAAVAPLRGEEVAELLGEGFQHPYQQERVAGRAPRIFIGSGELGYTLSHPRFGVYFYEAMSDRERSAVEGRFLEAGRRALDGLREGSLQPADTLPYVVLHTKDHLLRALPAGQAQPRDLYDLLCEPWLRAHEVHSGTPASFLEDVDAAWRVAGQQPTGDPGVQVLCALCYSSITTLSSKIDDEVILQCYRVGVLNKAQALVYLRRNQNFSERAIGLARMGEAETIPGEQHRLIQEALEAVEQIEEAYNRPFALALMVPYLPVDQALEIASQITDPYPQVLALAAIAPRLPVEQRAAVLEEALETARRLDDSRSRTDALAAMASQVSAEQRHVILQEAFAAANELTHFYERESALLSIIPQLPPDQALQVAQEMEVPKFRGYVLASLAPQLPPDQALALVHSMDVPAQRALPLAKIARRLPPDQQASVLHEAIADAHIFDNPRNGPSVCAVVLASITPYLPAEQQRSIVAEALTIARQINDSHALIALAVLVPHLSADQQPAFLREALKAPRKPWVPTDRRDRVLVEVAPQLLPELALDAIHQIEEPSEHALALARLAHRLPSEHQQVILDEALTIIRKIKYPGIRAVALADVAAHVSTDQRDGLLQEALYTARQVGQVDERAETLAKVAPHLLPNQQPLVLQEALDLIRPLNHRDPALIQLALHLPPEQAVDAAGKIDNPADRAKAMAEIASRLPPDQALKVARQIDDKARRAHAMAEIADRLSHDRGLELARQIEYPSSRALALARIAVDLPRDRQADILREAFEVNGQNIEFHSASVGFVDLIPYLPSKYLPDIWSDVLEGALPWLPEPLATRWIELCDAAGVSPGSALMKTLQAFQLAKREVFIEQVVALEPVIRQLGGEEALQQTAEAILAVGKWWP